MFWLVKDKIPGWYFEISNIDEVTKQNANAWHDMEHDIVSAGVFINKSDWRKKEQLCVTPQNAEHPTSPATSIEAIKEVIEEHGFKVTGAKEKFLDITRIGPKKFHFSSITDPNERI